MFEAGQSARALGRITRAVGMRARARQLSAVHDEVFVADGAFFELALQNFTRARSVTRLRGKAGARKCAASCRGAAWCARMILRRRLREPHVAGIASKLSAFQRTDDGVAIADFAAGSVDDIGAALHLGDKLFVEQVLGLGMQRALMVTTSHTFTISWTLGW